MEKRPNLELRVIILKDESVLLSRIRDSFKTPYLKEWDFPSGPLEYGYDADSCIIKILNEFVPKLEVNLSGWFPQAATNDYIEKKDKPPDKHLISLFYTVRYRLGSPEFLKPDEKSKYDLFEWINWEDLSKVQLKREISLPVKSLINQGYNPFERENLLEEENKPNINLYSKNSKSSKKVLA